MGIQIWNFIQPWFTIVAACSIGIILAAVAVGAIVTVVRYIIDG